MFFIYFDIYYTLGWYPLLNFLIIFPPKLTDTFARDSEKYTRTVLCLPTRTRTHTVNIHI